MKFKFSVTIVLCVLLINTVAAQNASVTFSDKIKSTSGIFTNGIYMKSIAGEAEDVISVFGIRFNKITTVSYNTTINEFPGIKLMRFSKTLEPLGELDFSFPVDAGKTGFLDFVKLKSTYYVLSYEIDKSSDIMQINYQQINPSNLSIQGPVKRLTTLNLSAYENSNRIEPSDLSIDYSSDSTKILFTYEPDLKKKENKEVVIVAADSKMSVITNTTHNFQELEKKVRLNDASIDNEGKIYLSYNVYEKDYEKDYVKSDGNKIPGFVTSICIVDGKKETNYSFASEGKFIHQSSIAYDENGKTCVIGLYKDAYNGRISGAFKAVINETKKVIGSPTVFAAIPQKILDKVDIDNMGKKDGKKAGLDNDFHIRYSFSILPEGTIKFMSEFQEIIGSTGSVEMWGDVLITTFNQDNKATFSLVSKKQATVWQAYGGYRIRRMYNFKFVAGSFEPIFFKNKLLIFYNDNEDNFSKDPAKQPDQMNNPDKSTLIMAEVLPNGEIKKKEVFSHRDYGGYITNMNFHYLKEGTYSIFALYYGFLKYGLKTGILTIK